MATNNLNGKSLESWIWDAACSIRGAKDAPKFRQGNRLQTFDRAVANPMWNQTEFKEKDYDADELDRFPKGAGFPGGKADWGWVQHILASLKPQGRAAVVLDTGDADEYRPIAEIVEELDALEEEAKETDKALKAVLGRIMG